MNSGILISSGVSLFIVMDDSKIIQGIAGLQGEKMWQQIDDLVVRWSRRNPRAANMNMHHNQEVRDGLEDKKFAKSTSMADGRLLLSIHPELVNFIETFYSDFFTSKENVRTFAKRYKMFAIAEEQ